VGGRRLLPKPSGRTASSGVRVRLQRQRHTGKRSTAATVHSGYKIDLKGFDDRHYRTLGCPLANILDGIRMVHERGLWLESSRF